MITQLDIGMICMDLPDGRILSTCATPFHGEKGEFVFDEHYDPSAMLKRLTVCRDRIDRGYERWENGEI